MLYLGSYYSAFYSILVWAPASKNWRALLWLLPPAVPGSAESLGEAVHGLACSDGNGVVLAAILVAPGGDEQ